MKVTLGTLIHPDQSGFIAGRNLADNVRKVVDTIKYAAEQKINALLILLDFKKAFDRVEYSSLLSVLKWMNFGDTMVSWVKLLFTDFNLCTVNNGYSSEYFMPTRGLFQGNPISSYGFLLVIELLAINLRKNKDIQGVPIGTLNNLLSLFADDISIFTLNKERNWQEISRELRAFQQSTGLKVNMEKTVVYRFGVAKQANAKYYSMKKMQWSDKPVRVLSILVSDNDEEMLNINLQKTMQTAEGILQQWTKRNPSLIGRIQTINSRFVICAPINSAEIHTL